MKKYEPSVKINNELKNEIVAELKAFVYKLEKKIYDKDLDNETVSESVMQLKNLYSSLDAAIGTGDENISVLYAEALLQIKALKKQSEQSHSHRFENAVDELSYTITLWKDVLDGCTVVETPEDIEKEKISRTRKKLNSRLIELEMIKCDFFVNEKRIEKEIGILEKDLAEYEASMLKEDNERKINDIYREIKAVKSKIDMLAVRKSNYSACFNLLDVIYANANEILKATDYAAEEIGKAKVLLNIDKLKKVVVDPDKAINVLKQMDKDIKEIAERTASIDQKIFGLETGAATINEDAMKYKEQLMRKNREKEELNAEIANEILDVDKAKIDVEDK